jgi:membrane-associated phospholipid phosphatase
MDAIFDLGINLILFLQSLGGWLVTIMRGFSFLGNEEFYLFVAPLIYWCIDSSLGFRMAIVLLTSNAINSMFKLALHHPRPYWVDGRVIAHSAETSLGAPSGHSQNAVAVWGRLAVGANRKWFWITAGVIVFMIGLSRLVLGVHFLHDVLMGWLVGALLLWIILVLEKRLQPRLDAMRPSEKALWAFGGSLFILLAGALVALWLSMTGWSMPLDWVTQAITAAPGSEPINPLSLQGLITSGGTFFGLALGVILLQTRGGMHMPAPFWNLVGRFVVGLAGVLALRYGLGAIFPGGDGLMPYILRYIRYAIIGLWITGLAPLLFIKMRLAQTKSGR